MLNTYFYLSNILSIVKYNINFEKVWKINSQTNIIFVVEDQKVYGH